jgi:hypothetical protein
LFGLAVQADGRRIVGSCCAAKSCRVEPAFRVQLDYLLQESDSKISWLLLPVSWELWYKDPYYLRDEKGELAYYCNIVKFAGLLVQPKTNSELGRVGMLYFIQNVRSFDLVVMVKAVLEAKPRLVMIS